MHIKLGCLWQMFPVNAFRIDSALKSSSVKYPTGAHFQEKPFAIKLMNFKKFLKAFQN